MGFGLLMLGAVVSLNVVLSKIGGDRIGQHYVAIQKNKGK